MVATYRSSTSYPYTSSTVNTVLSPPSGLSNGDILIAVSARGLATAAPAVTPPTGFTQIGTETSLFDTASFNVKTDIFWKLASNESGSYTFTHSSCTANGLLMAFSGCQSNPIDSSSQNTGTGATLVATSITTTETNDLLLFISQNWGDVQAVIPTGYSPIYNPTAGVGGGIIMAGYQILPAAGSSGNPTTGTSGSVGNPISDPWSSFIIGLFSAGSVQILFQGGQMLRVM